MIYVPLICTMVEQASGGGGMSSASHAFSTFCAATFAWEGLTGNHFGGIVNIPSKPLSLSDRYRTSSRTCRQWWQCGRNCLRDMLCLPSVCVPGTGGCSIPCTSEGRPNAGHTEK
jgi:hypothetical protein